MARSIATLSATANPKIQAGFGPLVPGFRVALNDIEAVQPRHGRQPRRGRPSSWKPSRAKAASTQPASSSCSNCAAVRRAQPAADAGRGAMRPGAHRQVVCPPVGRHSARRDAPGQGPGLGCADWRVVCGPRAAGVLTAPGSHGSTFGGNPLAMRAGVETLTVMEEDGLLEPMPRQVGRTCERRCWPGWAWRRRRNPRPGPDARHRTRPPCGVLLAAALAVPACC